MIERFIRSMKVECTRQILVPFRVDAMREELACYVIRYNEHRPHQGLDGLTPAEVFGGEASLNPGVPFEPRPRWPATGKSRNTHALRLHLTITFVEGRRHLPVVELTRAS